MRKIICTLATTAAVQTTYIGTPTFSTTNCVLLLVRLPLKSFSPYHSDSKEILWPVVRAAENISLCMLIVKIGNVKTMRVDFRLEVDHVIILQVRLMTGTKEICIICPIYASLHT